MMPAIWLLALAFPLAVGLLRSLDLSWGAAFLAVLTLYAVAGIIAAFNILLIAF